MSKVNGPASYALRLKVRAWQKQMMLDKESILPERRSSWEAGDYLPPLLLTASVDDDYEYCVREHARLR